ncbi:MAG TPA: hypothetical protein VGB63_16390 [Pedobacter sp.]
MASTNKWLFSMFILWLFNFNVKAQTADEIFNQKKTQLRYLAEQIVSLRVYAGYVHDGYEIVSDGVQNVKSLKNGEFNLHDTYFKSLKVINPSIRSSRKIAEIISLQSNILKSLNKMERLQYLPAYQREYIVNVKTQVLVECQKDLEELSLVITSNQLEMKDEERIQRIDKIQAAMSDKMNFTLSFCNELSILVHQKRSEERSITHTRKLYEDH